MLLQSNPIELMVWTEWNMFWYTAWIIAKKSPKVAIYFAKIARLGHVPTPTGVYTFTDARVKVPGP